MTKSKPQAQQLTRPPVKGAPGKAAPSKSQGGGDAVAHRLKTTTPGTTPHKKAGAEAKKPHRYRPGTVALRQIRKEQGNSYKKFALRKAPLIRLIREIAQEYQIKHGEGIRFTKGSLEAFQVATEHFGIDTMKEANFFAMAAKRVTLMQRDMRHAFAFKHCCDDNGKADLGDKDTRFLDAVHTTPSEREGMHAEAKKEREEAEEADAKDKAKKKSSKKGKLSGGGTGKAPRPATKPSSKKVSQKGKDEKDKEPATNDSADTAMTSEQKQEPAPTETAVVAKDTSTAGPKRKSAVSMHGRGGQRRKQPAAAADTSAAKEQVLAGVSDSQVAFAMDVMAGTPEPSQMD